MKRKVIFDCDPGHDDAFALAYLNKTKAFDVLMVSSVAGNVGIEHTTRNLQGLTKALDWDVKVCRGAARPLIGEQLIAANIHGQNGLFGYEFADSELTPLSQRNFLKAAVSILEQAAEPVTIIAVGPLTNIASLVLLRPDLLSKIQEISIMGGGLGGGNWTTCGEFNILADPEAAQIIFSCGVPIIMAGLDVTQQAHFTRTDLDLLKTSEQKISKILSAVSEKTFELQPEVNARGYMRLHDVLAVMVLLHPDFFSVENLFVQVETEGRLTRGLTVANRLGNEKRSPNTRALVGIDQTAFLNELMETLLK